MVSIPPLPCLCRYLKKLLLWCVVTGVPTDTLPVDGCPMSITIEQIVKKVADFYGVESSCINTRSRKREIVLVRQVAMYLAKKYLDLSTSKIGQRIGNRDHATVLHACKTITNLAETDKQFRHELSPTLLINFLIKLFNPIAAKNRIVAIVDA